MLGFKKKPQQQQAPKQASGMNMAIANMHRFTIQLVALMLAIANLMALILSAISVVAGVVTVTILQFPGAYALWVVAFIVGPLLSLLVESGTLNRLIRVRLMDREIQVMRAKMEASAEKLQTSIRVPDPNQPDYSQAMKQYRKACATVEADARNRYKRATRDQRKTRRLALIMALACAGASAFAGGIFYHIILAGLGPIWDMAASVVFPLVVTGTFISTELNKDEQEATIREGFGGGSLAETAIREETKLQAFKSVSAKTIAYLDKPEAEKDIDAGTRILVQDILAELNEDARKRTRQRQVTIEEDMTENNMPVALLPEAELEGTQNGAQNLESEQGESVQPRAVNNAQNAAQSESAERPSPAQLSSVQPSAPQQKIGRPSPAQSNAQKSGAQRLRVVSGSTGPLEVVRALITDNPTISDRELGRLIGKAPATAKKYHQQIKQEQLSSPYLLNTKEAGV